jgi:hypothetical protein
MQPGLYELCGQFEQVFLATLVPQSALGSHAASGGDLAGSDDGLDDPTNGAEQTAALFTQAFAAALERAGGLGLGRELYRAFAGANR